MSHCGMRHVALIFIFQDLWHTKALELFFILSEYLIVSLFISILTHNCSYFPLSILTGCRRIISNRGEKSRGRNNSKKHIMLFWLLNFCVGLVLIMKKGRREEGFGGVTHSSSEKAGSSDLWESKNTLCGNLGQHNFKMKLQKVKFTTVP